MYSRIEAFLDLRHGCRVRLNSIVAKFLIIEVLPRIDMIFGYCDNNFIQISIDQSRGWGYVSFRIFINIDPKVGGRRNNCGGAWARGAQDFVLGVGFF